MKLPASCALRVGLSAACIWIFCGEMTCAQELPEGGNRTSESGPQLRVFVTKTKFRAGELIPLDLQFTSATSDRYQINLATYDRSGRVSYEQFLLDPKEGTSDPLELYFNSAWGFLGGGLTGFKLLSTSPTSIHLDLNEWVRFDLPGTYRLTVRICHKINRTHFRQRVEVSCSSNLRGICRARFESRPPLRP